MFAHATKPILGENIPATACQNYRRCQKFASRLMLSASLALFSPEALLTFGHGQVSWIEKAQASGGSGEQSRDGDAFTDLVALKDETLEKQRGGFSVGGLEIAIGLSVSTAVEGIIEVTTNYSLNSDQGLVNLGSEITQLTQDLTSDLSESIQATVTDIMSDIEEETNSNPVDATVPIPVTLSISEGSSYDNDISDPLGGDTTLTNPINETAPSPAMATGTVTDPDIIPSDTMPATPAMATGIVTDPDILPSDTMPATTTISTPINSETPVPETLVEIIHQTGESHVTLLTNRLNNVSIKQTVTLNITVENFAQIKGFARLQKDMDLIARQINLFSLRR